ncbi:MAG TPA: type II CAAX endopeptidase family protein [Candidatus Acidoferrales bacterium]|nr:type II CAAX endopeptidase family protein [Candidatus Acidoferrales bacterium]
MSTVNGPPAPEQPPFQTGVFTSSGRAGAIARLLIYLAIATVAFLVFSTIIAITLHPEPAFFLTPLGLFLNELSFALSAIGAAAIMALLENRPLGCYGLPGRETFGKHFWQGAAWGLAEVTALILVIAAFHGYSFGNIALHSRDLARYALLWGVAFLMTGFSEEFLFRGYVQYTLGSVIGFWPTAVLGSAGFGAFHLYNQGESWAGAAGVVTIGMFFCLTLRRTGSLWFAVGMHAAFDFGETFLYSVPNSGFVGQGHLSNASLHGPAWLTGGTVGPEGSVFSFLTMALLFVLFARFYPAKAKSQLG